MHEFPANPNDQDIFEISPGLLFKFEAATNSWIRIAGTEIYPLASPLNKGLMAATDLRKLNRLVIQPPRSTITAENCDGKFISGHINIYGADDFVQITGKPLLRNKNVEHKQKFRISLHTSAFNFTIDKEALITELIKRGQLNLIGKRGPKGKKGSKGNPGQVLPTGPKGPKGNKGIGPPCETVIVPETLKSEIVPGTNKAIVGVETRPISSNEQELVLKRGIVGNPDAAPKRVNAKCGENSTWLLAVQRPTGEPQQLIYVDVSNIINTVFEKFKSEAQRLKKKHEDDVKFWLETISILFHEQKAALCCALTLCEKQLAQETRDQVQLVSIIDPVTIQGTVTVLGTSESSSTSSTLPPFSLLPFDLGQFETNQWQGPEFLIVDGNLNAGTLDDATTLELEKGHYIVEVAEHGLNEESGNIVLIYEHNKSKVSEYLRAGTLTEIDHDGEIVFAYILGPKSPGRAVLRFTEKSEAYACQIAIERLARYAESWDKGRCQGFVTKLDNQDYVIIIRCEDGLDEGIARVQDQLEGSLALAWPTLDGKSFMPLPDINDLTFRYDKRLNNQLKHNLDNKLYSEASKEIGQIELSNVLFPSLI